MQEHEQAVASLLACLEAAARSFAGQSALHIDPSREVAAPPALVATLEPSADDVPVVALQPHLSLLNLPPPAARS